MILTDVNPMRLSYFVHFKATESKKNIYNEIASATADVQINIIDINDNRPEFYKCGVSCLNTTHFTGEVFEETLGSISINMTVKDMDKVRGRLNFTKGGPS